MLIHLIFKNDKWKENGTLKETEANIFFCRLNHTDVQKNGAGEHRNIYTVGNHGDYNPPTHLSAVLFKAPLRNRS
jgi:hypothetical protein